MLMTQLWVWVEARQIAGEASGVDDWIRVSRSASEWTDNTPSTEHANADVQYDRLMPAM